MRVLKKSVLAFRFLLFVLCLSFITPVIGSAAVHVAVQDAPDRPSDGEDFFRFFNRITRGGQFPGIYLRVPSEFEPYFYHWIFRGTWVGLLEQAKKRLESQGVDLWGQWYHNEYPLSFGFDESVRSGLFPVLEKALKDAGARDIATLQSTPWPDWSFAERRAFTFAFFFEAKLFHGLALVDIVAGNFGLRGEELRSNATCDILVHEEFVKKVRELGWNGEVYFRGITAPDPQDKSRHVVYLDGEALSGGSPFSYSLLKLYEWAGILSHEFSHVAQDIEAGRLGYELGVYGAESLLLIEGMAEFLSERAMRDASAMLAGSNSFTLFPPEQGVEVVYREGNNTTGNLFPYTVGLPFAAAWYAYAAEGKKSEAWLRNRMYSVITQKLKLQDALKMEP